MQTISKRVGQASSSRIALTPASRLQAMVADHGTSPTQHLIPPCGRSLETLPDLINALEQLAPSDIERFIIEVLIT